MITNDTEHLASQSLWKVTNYHISLPYIKKHPEFTYTVDGSYLYNIVLQESNTASNICKQTSHIYTAKSTGVGYKRVFGSTYM